MPPQFSCVPLRSTSENCAVLPCFSDFGCFPTAHFLTFPNADRGLKPKKEHTGYVVMNTQEKKLQRKDHRGYYTITLWETVLQSPYSVDFTEEQARHQICEDLMQSENGTAWALNRIGIREKPDPREDPAEYSKIMKNENVMVSYQLRANYQARRGEKTGFWDIILVHQKPILQVPKDMRP